MQNIALLLTVILTGGLLLVFMTVIMNSRERVDFAAVTARGYRIRSVWFYLLAAAGVLITVVTVPAGLAPARGPAAENATETKVIKAIGYQWYWEMTAEEVETGQQVEFQITSADVNHGFGIYDEAMRLVAQAQSMPGYVNRLNVTFDEPGVYQILCLEYCGLSHHDMIGEVIVTAAQAGGEE